MVINAEQYLTFSFCKFQTLLIKPKNNRHQRRFNTGTDVVQSTAPAAHTNQSSPEQALLGSSAVVIRICVIRIEATRL